MDIESLKAILAVQTCGSLAGAARALDLDPSSVSRTVAAVEAELGIRLFQRTTRKLTVTEAGQHFLRRIRPLIDEMDVAFEDAQGRRSQPSGMLRLTASVAYSAEVIVPLLTGFQDAYPDVSVELQSTDVNVDLVENGIDLAIRLAPSPSGDLISSRLATTRYMAVASPHYLKGRDVGPAPSCLSELNCLQYSLPGFANRWLFRSGSEQAVDVPISGSLAASNALVLRNAARQGMGVALLADWLVDRDLRDGRLVELFPGTYGALTEFDTAAWALYPTRSYLPRKVRVMIDYLRTHMADEREYW